MEIDKVEKVHSIGYRLKDAKFTVNHDVKFNVAGVKIEATQGDTNIIPQWIGKILFDNNLGILDSPDMITELKQALSKEKMVGEYQISTLDPHFYIKLRESLKELKKVYNRGFSSGFYIKLPTREDFSTSENGEATERKHILGRIEKNLGP